MQTGSYSVQTATVQRIASNERCLAEDVIGIVILVHTI
jgi:hypothetical protein